MRHAYLLFFIAIQLFSFSSFAKAFKVDKRDLNIQIPDMDRVTYSLGVASLDNIEKISLKLKIEHTYVKDLRISLIHPAGKRVLLRQREWGGYDGLVETYTSYENKGLDYLRELPTKGQWLLEVRDEAGEDYGRIIDVLLEIDAGESYENPNSNIDNGNEKSCGSIWKNILSKGKLKSVYNSTRNLCGKEFRDALRSAIIKNKRFSSSDRKNYKKAREIMFSSLDNDSETVCGVYSGRCIQTMTIPNGNNMNCEHTWPQSKGAVGTAKSDLHHLYPADAKLNSLRGNNPFCEVVSIITDSGKSFLGRSEFGTRCFEPQDSHKGNLARSMMYFSLRYEKAIDEEQESFFKKWNKEDLVDYSEVSRNNEIERYQENRNPFVDYPEFADLITNF